MNAFREKLPLNLQQSWINADDNSPDHPLKQVVNDEVGLSHHDQQSDVGPTELWRQRQAHMFKLDRV